MQPSTRIGPMPADFNLLPRGADADAKPRADGWSVVLVNIQRATGNVSLMCSGTRAAT